MDDKQHILFQPSLSVKKEQVINAMNWMLKDIKWHYRQSKSIPDNLPDSEVDWSPQIREAITLLEELCQ